VSEISPHSAVLDFISAAPLHSFDDRVFNDLALRVFDYQYRYNSIYRRYCDQARPNLGRPENWTSIPAVTTSAFKRVPLTCFPPERAVRVFHTSGTTQEHSGKHYFRTLQFYRQALLRSFRAYCLPDQQALRMLFLGPTIEHFPYSSLGYMFSTIRDEFGATGSASFVKSDSADVEGFRLAVEASIREHEPVFILGTAFSLLQGVDHLAAQGVQLPLPAGSRILDTGGYKGRTREVPRDEFQELLCRTFGLSRDSLLNEYGMTELSSQFYESRLPGTPLRDPRANIKFMPPWVRALAIDPDTLQPLPAGERGMLRILDLANLESVMAIQTEDIGRAWQDRIELIGRAEGADLRGCSLLTETIVEG